MCRGIPAARTGALYGWLRPEILCRCMARRRHMREQARLGRACGIPRAGRPEKWRRAGAPCVPSPSNFNPRRIVRLATILSAVLFALYYANYTQGWISVDDLNLAAGHSD
jgi:hypothetical protein